MTDHGTDLVVALGLGRVRHVTGTRQQRFHTVLSLSIGANIDPSISTSAESKPLHVFTT